MKTVSMMCIVFCLHLGVSSMVIRNYSDQKDGGSKKETGSFNEDYLFLGQDLHFSGSAEDLVFIGRNLTFSGTTQLGLFAACKDLTYSGLSGNGIAVGCMNITIDGNITGTSYAGCKTFRLSENGTVRGNLFIGCAKLIIDGTVDGDVYAGAGEVIINGAINGSVIARSGQIVIGDKGKISGNLDYSSKEKLSDADSAKVAGKVTRDTTQEYGRKRRFPFLFLFYLAMLASFAIVGSLLLLLPVFRSLDGKRAAISFWKTMLWGLIPLLLYPAIIVLCFVLIVTIPFAFVLLLAGIPLLYLACIIGNTLIGRYLATLFNWNITKRHYYFLIGVFITAIILAVPFINIPGFILIAALGFGVYLSFLFRKDVAGGG